MRNPLVTLWGYGFEETGFLGRWRSQIVMHHFILTTQVSFWDGFEQQRGPAVEHEFEHLVSAAKQHASPSKVRTHPVRNQGSLWYKVAQLH